MNEQLDYRWAQQEDLAHYEDFLKNTYGPQSPQALSGRARWLFWDNPLGRHVTLCRCGDRIVGACGLLPYPLPASCRSTLAAFGIDMMVAADVRRHGIARGLLEMRRDRFPLSLSSGQSEQMSAVYRSAGGRDVGAVWLGRARRRFPRLAPARVLARDVLAWATLRIRPPVGTPHRVELTGVAASDYLMSRMSEFAPEQAPADVASWFRWRYRGPVYRDYQFWRVGDASGEGLLVTRQEQGEELIIDLRTRPPETSRLLTAAFATSSRPDTVVRGGGAGFGAVLRTAGCWRQRTPVHIVAMAACRTSPAEELVSLALWSGASDIDLMRIPQTPTNTAGS